MATILQPKKHDEAAKKQHLIPRCYVKPWYIGSSESVWAYNKKEKYHSGVNSEWDIERRNIERILQINGFMILKRVLSVCRKMQSTRFLMTSCNLM